MTIIVGAVEGEHVYLGADSRASWGELARPLSIPKVWKQGGIVLGLTGRMREQQIIQYCTTLPALPDASDASDASDDLLRWLCTDFVNVIRGARKAAGFDERMEGQAQCEYGPCLMIGVRGRLFTLHGDYSVAEYPEGNAVGSGETAARGSLHTTRAFDLSAEARIDLALHAACAHNVYCAPPFNYVNTSE